MVRYHQDLKISYTIIFHIITRSRHNKYVAGAKYKIAEENADTPRKIEEYKHNSKHTYKQYVELKDVNTHKQRLTCNSKPV